MAVYFIANIRMEDEEHYQKYLDAAGDVFSRYKGTYLAVDNNPLVLEGTWDYSRGVLISFPSREDFDAWYHSEDYQEILQYRLEAAQCDTILVEGL